MQLMRAHLNDRMKPFKLEQYVMNKEGVIELKKIPLYACARDGIPYGTLGHEELCLSSLQDQAQNDALREIKEAVRATNGFTGTKGCGGTCPSRFWGGASSDACG